MNKKLIVGIGIAVAVVILAALSSSSLAPGVQKPSGATTPGPSTPSISPVQTTTTVPAKKSYTLDLNETVGIAAK